MYAPYPSSLPDKATSVFFLDLNILRTIVQYICTVNEDFLHVIKSERWSSEEFDYPEYILDPLKRVFMFIAYIEAIQNPSQCKQLLTPRENYVINTGTSNLLWAEVCCSSSIIKAFSIPLQLNKGTSCFYKRHPTNQFVTQIVIKMLRDISLNDKILTMDQVAVCYLRDDTLKLLPPTSFQKLYYIRRAFKHNEGYVGCGFPLPIAQGSIVEMCSSLRPKIAAVFKEIIEQIKSFFQNLCLPKISEVMHWVAEKFEDLKEMFYTVFSNAVKHSLIHTDKVTLIIHGICWAISIIMLGCAGFITWRTVNVMLKSKNINIEVPEAQGPQTIPWLIMTISTILGVTISEKSFSFQVLTKIMKGIAFGSTVLTAGAVILYMLPISVRLFLIENFGTEQQKLGLRVEDWISSISKSQSLSYEVQVFRNADFRSHIASLHKTGLDLIFRTKHYTDLSKMVLPWFQRLSKIHKTVVMYESTRLKRDEPFGIHICAKPGVGKSLILEALVEDVTGWKPQDIYTHSVGQEYTVGYMGEPVYVKDEFLVGDIPTKVQDVLPHLVLKSSAQCRPNFPSIDDPISGIKGTIIMPEVVITLNNTPYDRVDGFDDYAIQRRREVNLQFARKGQTGVHDQQKAKPIHDLSEDVIRDKEFLLCRLLPTVHDPDYDKTPWISYPDAVELIKDKYQDFLATADKIRQAFNLGPKPSLDVDRMVQEAMDNGTFTAPVNLMEKLSGLFALAQSEIGERVSDVSSTSSNLCLAELYSPETEEKEVEDDICFDELDEDMQQILIKKGVFNEIGEMIEREKVEPHSLLSHHYETLRGKNKKIDRWTKVVVKVKAIECSDEEARIVKRGITNCPRAKAHIADSVLNKIVAAGYSSPLLEVFGEVLSCNTNEFVYEEYSKAQYAEYLAKKIVNSLSPYNKSTESMLGFIDLGGEITLLTNTKLFIVPVCLALGSVLAIGACSLAKYFGSSEAVGQSEKKERQTTVKKRPQVLRPLQKGELEAQGFFNENIVATANFPSASVRVKLLCVSQRIFVTYSHWLRRNSTPISLVINVSGKPVEWMWDPTKVLISDSSDLLFINMDSNHIPLGKNITSRFLREDQLNLISECAVYLPLENKVQHSHAYREDEIKYLVPSNQSSITIDQPLVYSAQTQTGDCGTPVITSDGLYANHIIGIHVAGFSSVFTSSKAYGTPIYKETVEEAIQCLTEIPVSQGSDTHLCDEFVNNINDYPNLLYAQQNVRHVFLSNKTKITKSIFYGKLNSPTDKSPAILSSNDPRSRGQNPTKLALKKIFEARKGKMDAKILKQVRDSLLYRFLNSVNFPIKRSLTFDEAVTGIPGLLSSMNSRTSPGYPLLTFQNVRKGKQDYIRYEGDRVIVDQAFKDLVLRRISEMEEGLEPQNYFVGFLKDELRSQKKIDEIQTRITFANDMISLVAFRMKFGGFLIAMNNGFEKTGFAIGINQYSRDMQKVFDLLKFREGNEFFDGDLAGYDLSLPAQLLETAYDLVGYIFVHVMDADENSVKYFMKHEMEGKVMMGNLIFKSVMNYSGCFLTTIINCICLNLAFRYIFKVRFMLLDFDDHVKIVILGDDHVISKVIGFNWTPQMIAEDFEQIGMTYTCADKSDIATSTFKSFEDIIFLGATPKKFSDEDDTYVGVSKITSLLDSLQFTRNGNLTIKEEAISKLELLSMYDKEFYVEKRDLILKVARDNNIKIDWLITQAELRNRVSFRCTFMQPIAQSSLPEELTMPQSQNLKPLDTSTDLPNLQAPVEGLTTLTSNNPKPASDYESSAIPNNAGRAINEQAMDLGFGLESMIKRTTVTWSTTDNRTSVIGSFALPWGLLSLGNVNNIQNMPFNNFIYFVGDLELTFQVNGVPTQAGLLTAYHVPLYNGSTVYEDWTSYNHVFLTPADNACKKLLIPFKFWRTAMNSYAGALGEESLGQLILGVTEPLSSLSASSCSITIFSRFVNAKFSIPRPLAQGELDDALPVAQGNTTSNVSYNIGSVAGSVPVENKIDASHSITASATIPMDNPPLTGCSVPIAGVYPSMSKNKGLEPTVSMQHHPEMMNREAHMLTDPMVTDINNILSRRFLLRAINWNASQTAGTSLFQTSLNSMVLDSYGYDNVVPIGPALLSQFARWRADIVFEVYVNRTTFHSGRLLATTAYGSPSIPSGTENIYYNEVMDFNGDNYWNSIKIVYNASTEFLRTYEGPNAAEEILDHSLGLFKLSVLNPLKITSTIVPDNVGILLFVHFENVRVYELKMNPIAQLTPDFPNGTLTAQGALLQLTAQGDKPMAAENVIDPDLGDGAPTTTEETKLVSKTPYSLETGRKYEYTISNLLEVLRRHYELSFAQTAVGTPLFSTTPPSTATAMLWKVEVRPHHRFSQLFAGWSGHMKYRIIIKTDLPVYYTYVCNNKGASTDLDGGLLAKGYYSSSNILGTNPQRIITTNGTANNNNIPWEVAYPTSSSQAMIDVSIPFNTHLNFLPTLPNDTFGANPALPASTFNFSNGYLGILVQETTSNVKIFEAVGDDFRYHLWRPLTATRLRPYRGTGAPVAGDVIGDNRF